MGEDCRTGGKGEGNRFFPLFLFILIVVVAVVVFVIIFGSRTWHNERKGRKRKTYEKTNEQKKSSINSNEAVPRSNNFRCSRIKDAHYRNSNTRGCSALNGVCTKVHANGLTNHVAPVCTGL